MTPWLWSELHDLFDTDDGSLPEIRVNYVSGEALVAGYALLRRRARQVFPEDAQFWSRREGAERPLDSVPNAADLVVSGEAAPFQLVLRGIQSDDVAIDDLGVCVFQAQLALDYRMGPSWGPSQLEALFELLADLSALDDRACVTLEEGVRPEIIDRFQHAWSRWLAEDAARRT